MPAPIRIVLTEEEDRTLLELRVATSVPQRARDRAQMLRLNAQGWNTPAIAEIEEVSSAYRKSHNSALAFRWVRRFVGSPRAGSKG